MIAAVKQQDSLKVVQAILADRRFSQPILEKSEFQGVGYIDFAGYKSISALYIKEDGRSVPLVLTSPSGDFEIKRHGGQLEISSRVILPQLFQQFITAARNCNQTDVEFILHNVKPELLSPTIFGSGWDVWGSGQAGQSAERCLQGRQTQTENKTKIVIKELRKHNPSYQNILFLGCGDGVDVKTFLESEELNLKSCKITAIDQSKVALQTAEAICGEAKSKTGASLNFKQVDFNDIISLRSEEPYDLVISVGIFDRETLRFEQGVNLASKLRMLIKPDGILVASAYALELFEKKNYQDLGYVPLQCAVTEHLFTEKYVPLYIMKNSLSAIKQTEDSVASRSYRIWQ